jgi:hypothetical protein
MLCSIARIATHNSLIFSEVDGNEIAHNNRRKVRNR